MKENLQGTEVSDDIDDEFDIDALISEAGKTDHAANIGDFDENTLSQLLTENVESSEKDGAYDEQDLSPDFSDENVLADLLSDANKDQNNQTINEPKASNEVDGIQEFDNVDFDELLANIEEESNKSVNQETSEHDDIGDQLIENLQEADEDNMQLASSDDVDKDYLSVDSLLSESMAEIDNSEPYDKTNIDVGLGAFASMGESEKAIDVDKGNAMTEKLDLAKVYLEMDDNENAQVILQQVLKKGDIDQQSQAQALLNKLSL